MTELVIYDALCRAMAEAVAVDEVKNIVDQAEAMRHAARIAGDKGLEISAAQLRFRGERRLGELLVAAKDAGQVTGGRPEKNPSQSEGFSRVVLKEAGIDHKLSSRAQRMAALPAETFESRLEQHAEEMRAGVGRVAMDLLKVGAEAAGREARRQLARDLSAGTIALPTGQKYPVIYADPPWQRNQGVTNRSYENHYPTMTWAEICALPVADLVLPDAWLFLWIPRAHLLAWHVAELPDLETGELRKQKMPLASAVALAWGFDAYSTAFVWTKNDEGHPDEAGGAVLVRDQDELLLLFRRGGGLPKPAGDEKFGSNHRERSRLLGHSTKPQHYRRMIATMAGAGVPVLEMFARFDADNPPPPAWDLWGNEAAPSRDESSDVHDLEQVAGTCDRPAAASLDDGLTQAGRQSVRGEAGEATGTSDAAASCHSEAAAPISEYDALKALGDFCHPRRAEICAAVGADYAARGLATERGSTGQWILREAGAARLRELEDALRPPPAPIVERDPLELPEFLRRNKDGQLRLGLVVPAKPDVIDDHVQTRLPVNAIELDEILALRAIANGEDAGPMARHVVGKGWAWVTATEIKLTEEGREALASFVDVGPAAEREARVS